MPKCCGDITEKVVTEAVRSFPQGTTGRGLLAQHLADALSSEYSPTFLAELTKTVRFLAEGRVPLVFAPFVAGATLMALDKTNEGVFDVRPIAAGEIMRRLVAKCLCSTHKVQAAKFFVPAGQFGVACPSGTERVFHHTRHVVDQQAGRFLGPTSTRNKLQFWTS